jgi:GNAT superfamily N-acetyltransferase
MMNENIIRKQAAYFFENGEVFIATAYREDNSNDIIWNIPGTLIDDFTLFANANKINNLFDEQALSKYREWFEHSIGAKKDSVFITISANYISKEKFNVTDNNVLYNQTASIENIKSNKLSENFIDAEQKSAAYIIDNTIVSIAFDNKNGSITVLTLPDFRNRGYATKCLKKLIEVYPINELGYATSIENKAAIRVAEKCGMQKTGTGYWIRLDSENGKRLFSQRPELFV